MATVTPGNAAMGPGTIYVADFGTTEPTGMATPGAGWTDVGGTLGGTTVSISQEFKDIEFDQIPMPVGARKTKEQVTVKLKLGEVTLSNLVLALNGGTISAQTGYDSYTPDLSDTSTEPDYKALIVDGAGAGGLTRRLILRKALNTENIDLEYTKDGQQVYAATFTGYYVSSSVDAYKLLQETAGS